MFFVVRSNDSFNFLLGWIKYIVIVVIVIVLLIIINFIYNAPVPVLQKRAPSTVQLHISGLIHSKEMHALKTTTTTTTKNSI